MSLSYDFSFPVSSRILIAGSSQSGKTSLVSRCLQFHSTAFREGVSHVIWFSCLPLSDVLLTELAECGLVVEQHIGLANIERILIEEHDRSWFKSNRVVVVLDDVAIDALSSAAVGRAFSIYAHHLPLSALFLISQSLTITNSRFSQLISRQLTHIILCKSRRLAGSLRYFSREIYPDHPTFMFDCFHDLLKSSEQKFNAIIFLTDPDNDQIFAFRGLFPGDQRIIYGPT